MGTHKPGDLVYLRGLEYMVNSFDGLNSEGLECYTLISANVRMVDGRPTNAFKAVLRQEPVFHIVGHE